MPDLVGQQPRRKHDVQLIPESAMLLSRLLEREARKQSVLKRFRPSTMKKLGNETQSTLSRYETSTVTGKSNVSYKSSRVSPAESNFSPGIYSNKIDEAQSTLRNRIWQCMHDPHSSQIARITSVTLLCAVFLASIVYILSTMPDLDESVKGSLAVIDVACIYIFTAEFFIRISCTPDLKKYFLDFFNWIDFVSIVPSYLEMFIDIKGSSIGVVRILRVLRVARILKLSRYTSTLQIFMKSLALSAKPLFMLLFLIIVAMIVFSSAMYFAELTDSPRFCRNPLQSKACHPSQNPPVNCCELNPFYSISATFWWCIVSMATVGYGEDYPVTPVGKLIASITLLSGMLILALPISVIGSNFQHVMKETMHDAMKQSLDTLSTLQVVQRKEMIEILNGFNILGDGIDVDPDELIALYDVDNTGRLQDDALEQFRRDVEALQKHNMKINPPQKVHKERLSFASSFTDLHQLQTDTLSKQLETMEEILEIRLLESEVRFENKLNGLMKIVSQMEKRVALLRN